MVFLGEVQATGRRVVIKHLRASVASDSMLHARFEQEARVLSSLNHPNIAGFIAFLEDQGNYFLVMEYVAGITLRERIVRDGPLPSREAKAILRGVLQGLSYAHECGIIHRDIKPSNIMIDPSYGAKILDFGIAKVIGSAGLTTSGHQLGTLLYMSPEQVLGRRDVDHRTDLYSLGVMLFEMATGRLPYDAYADSEYALMEQIVKTRTPDPRQYVASLDPILTHFITRVTEKSPSARLQTASECLDVVFRPMRTPPARTPVDDLLHIERSGIAPQEDTTEKTFRWIQLTYTLGFGLFLSGTIIYLVLTRGCKW